MSRVCFDPTCGEDAVAFVVFQALDVGRYSVRPFTMEADMCGEHLLELELDVEAGEAYIQEQTDYVTGDKWREDAWERIQHRRIEALRLSR